MSDAMRWPLKHIRRIVPRGFEPIRKEISTSLGHSVFHDFHTAFALMSLIPLLISVYLLAARLFTIEIFEGENGALFLIAIVIALLGFLIGRRVLQRVLLQLVAANTKLRQYEAMKSALIANIVHDLHSPLAAVRISLENIADGLMGPVSAGQKESLKNCEDILERINHVGTELLEVTGRRAGANLHREVFDIAGMLRAIVPSLTAANKADIRWITDLPGDSVLFLGDRAKFEQACQKVRDHIIQVGQEGSSAHLSLMRVPGEVRMLWRYKPYIQVLEAQAGVDPIKEPELPEGLELHLVREIVRLHHGQFWVDQPSEDDEELVISLPSLDATAAV